MTILGHESTPFLIISTFHCLWWNIYKSLFPCFWWSVHPWQFAFSFELATHDWKYSGLKMSCNCFHFIATKSHNTAFKIVLRQWRIGEEKQQGLEGHDFRSLELEEGVTGWGLAGFLGEAFWCRPHAQSPKSDFTVCLLQIKTHNPPNSQFSHL